MISKDFRPQFFREVAGNELAKKALKAIVKDKSKAPKVILLHGDYGSSKCVLGDTRVVTSKGYIKIKDLLPNAKEGFTPFEIDILSDEGWEKTDQFFKQSEAVVNLFKLADGSIVNGTNKHKVLALKGETVGMFRMDALEEGDYILKSTECKFGEYTKVDLKTAYLLGALQNRELSTVEIIKGSPKITFNMSTKLMRLIFPDAQATADLDNYKDKKAKLLPYITINSLMSNEPTIHEEIFRYSPTARVRFLQGFLNGFTPNQEGAITFTSDNEKLISSYMDLLDSLGLIYKKIVKSKGTRHKFDDSIEYEVAIPLCYPNNTLRCLETVEDSAYYNSIQIKLDKYLLKTLKKAKEKTSQNISSDSKLKNIFINLFTKSNKTHSIGYNDLLYIYYNFRDLPQVFIELIEAGVPQEIIGHSTVIDTVYDISVPGSHHFYGQGILNHNTTNSRIFAKAMNCENPQDGEPCGKCSVCKTNIQEAVFYNEYDSAVVGNIDTIRELRDTFLYTIAGMYKIIVLDEIHVASKPAQTALLKVLEESPQGVIFILATTHPHQLLPTIVSRSLEIPITRVSVQEVINNLESVSSKLDVTLSDKVKDIIAYKSKGHMRDAHMLLDLYLLLGEEDFIESVKSSREYLMRYLVAIIRKDKKYLEQALEGLMTIPVANTKDDWQQLLLDLAKEMTSPSDTPLGKIVKAFTPPNIMKLIKLASGEWFESSFNNDIALQTYLLCIYQIFTK